MPGTLRFPGTRSVLDGNYGDDFERVRIYDHELVLVHETAVTAERRLDEHDLLGYPKSVEPPRNSGADDYVEIHIRHSVARCETAMQGDLVYPRALLARKREPTRPGVSEAIGSSVPHSSKVTPVHAPTFFQSPTAFLTDETIPLVLSEIAPMHLGSVPRSGLSACRALLTESASAKLARLAELTCRGPTVPALGVTPADRTA